MDYFNIDRDECKACLRMTKLGINDICDFCKQFHKPKEKITPERIDEILAKYKKEREERLKEKQRGK